MPLAFADLFCGAGGLSLGFVLAGMEPLWALDSDPACAETYRANFPEDRFVLADAKAFDFSSLPAPEVLIGGPPCVSFSVAGRRLGPADSRDCIPDFVRAAEALRPRWFLMENVPGLLSACGCPGCAGRSVPEAHRGRYFSAVLERLRALGYRVWWRVLDAADYGVPQFRRRVFVVGRREGLSLSFAWPEPTHARPAECRQLRLFGPLPRPWVSVAEALADLAPEIAGLWDPYNACFRPGTLPGFTVQPEAMSRGPRRALSVAELPSLTVTATEHKGPTPKGNNRACDVLLRERSHTAQHGTGTPVCGPSATVSADRGLEVWTESALLWVDEIPHDGGPRVVDVTTRSAPAVDAQQGGRPRLIVASKRTRSAADAGGPSVTVAARGEESFVLEPSCRKPGGRAPRDFYSERLNVFPLRDHSRPGYTVAAKNDCSGSGARRGHVRRLTVEECARLQSFPDAFGFRGSKTARYRQIGNAVPPLLAWHMANAILRAEGLPFREPPDVRELYALRPPWGAGRG
jgi:DNA (cytosine-5)-methyltransferase 1